MAHSTLLSIALRPSAKRTALAISSLLLGLIMTVQAQVATLYTFGQGAGTYTDITGGTALWTNSFDDNVSGAQTIPSFTFNGTAYTTMYVSSNGFITFGSAPAANTYTPISGTEAYQRCVSAFGADLESATSGTRDVRWQTVSGEVVVQWRGVRRYSFFGVSESFNLQVRLNTSTGVIRTIYGPYGSGPANSTTGQPQVGLRGPNNTFATNVNNRTVGTGAENWGTSLIGANNGSTMRFTSGSPAKSWTSGLTYTWTPINCNQPSATASAASNCATSTYTINVVVTALNGAPSVNIQTPTGTNVFTNVGVGTYQVTGIPFGTARTVTVVHNGNSLCNLGLGSFNYTDPDQVCHSAAVYPIPDNGCGTNTYTTIPFCVSSAGTSLGSNVYVRSVDLIVSHSFNSDLELSLVSPGGTTVSLVADRFGSGDNIGNPGSCPGGLFTLQTGGTALSNANTNNVTGTWAPEQALTTFHNGSNPTGTWTLRACDDLGADVGAVQYVRVNLCLPPQATFTAVDNCGSGQFNVQVNVSTLGTGTTANLNYTVNGNPFFLANIGSGTTTIGPFAVGSEIICTVDNGISGCGSAQGTIYSNCPVTIPCGTTIPVTHCYRNNDTRTFSFVSSNPFETVTVTFIAGTMDPNDVIRAYSGSDNSGTPIPSLTGSFASLAGVSGSSTGNAIFIEIDSNGSNSCATGQQTSWSFEAECTPGCVDPDGTVAVNTNCALYNFTIDVEILFTGDAGTTTLRYAVNGGAPVNVPGLVETNIQTIGPFAMDAVVNVRLLHESDGSCDRNLGNFTDNNTCPSAENCVNALNLAGQTSPLPGTTTGRTNDFSFACGTATANTARDAIYFMDVPNGQQFRIHQLSNTYDSQHYVRYGPTCPGTTVIACVDNDGAEIAWVDWTNNTGATQRVWWIQDGFGTANGNFVLEWQLLSCPIPTANAASGITNLQAGANFTAPAGNYIVEWGPAATFTTPGNGLAPGANGTVINTTSSPVLITGLTANTQYRYFVRRNCGGGNFSPNTSAITFTTTNTPTVVANGSCGNNVAIADNGCGTNTFALASIAISGQPTALGTNVGLQSVEIILTHTFRSDLIISLVSPGGQEFQLITQRGGSGDNYGNNGSCPTAVFRLIASGAALTTIPATTANVTGNYAPEQALSSFNTGNPNGNWILKICDNAGIDTGSLRFVKLNFQPIDCLGVLGGTAMPGTACNDGNVCTINDTWTVACACAGTFQDTDGDGTCNANDGCPNDANKTAPGQCGCGVADTDSDSDGTANCNDGCPNDALKTAPGQCGCGVADTDGDNDGTANCNDGCPSDPNKVAPGICGCGTADTDSDGDGTPNCNDDCPNDPNKIAMGACGCGVADTDTDGDGIADCNDNCPNTPGQIGSPCNDGNIATINDVIGGNCLCAGSTVNCNDGNPCTADSYNGIMCVHAPLPDDDGDGTCDLIDGCPNDPNKVAPGICGCGTADTDTDNDGTADCNDGCPNDPSKLAPGTCGCGVADTDADGDGTPNCIDDCPNDPNKVAPGICGCGTADTDTDGDGTANCNDGCPNDANKVAPGACGCGVADTDTDADGTADCNDGCPNDPNKIAAGACGCGVADTDTDGDGTANCNDACPTDPNKIAPGICGCGTADTDSDSDGTANCNDGCPNDPNKIAPGVCGCGNADTDTDGDGTANCNDGCPNDPNKIAAGLCGCGTADTDSDSDGTPNCFDGCPNDPNKLVPGLCGCGTADTDSDGDGTPNCFDGCPNDPNKVAPGTCGCGVADTDSDGDGTADCNDGCPNDPNKLTPGTCGCGVSDADTDNDGLADCNDGCPNDPNKSAPGICGCGTADTDTDGDALADCIDPCPFLANQQNGNACDADPTSGYTLGQIVNCSCQPVTCTTNLQLEFQADGQSIVGWELRQQGTNTLVQSGGGWLPPTPSYSITTCLPNGCYYLRVTDDLGDGIINGGYILRTVGGNGKRLIDNRNNFTSGLVSQVANNEGFCLPMGTDRLIYVSCDRLDWTSGEYIVANDNADVAAQWGVGNQFDDGYEMWFFNPNGGYSFRRFHSHAVSDNFAPANAARACHIQINNWASTNFIPTGVLLNVRVRGRVNGVNSEWGSACRFKLDPQRAQCPLSKLFDQPASAYHSCGSSRSWGNGNYVHAKPVNGANRYQFRFRIPAENFSVTRTSNTYFLQLNWAPNSLQACKTYEVDVRVSKDGGQTWCTNFVPPALVDPWGDVCMLTINCAVQGGGQNLLMEDDASSSLLMYPNPNRGDQLYLKIDRIEDEVSTVSVDIYDTFGKRVAARRIAAGDGFLNAVIDLDGELAAGMYVVNVTVGGREYSQRLMIQP